jgi:hypothetical protein
MGGSVEGKIHDRNPNFRPQKQNPPEFDFVEGAV